MSPEVKNLKILTLILCNDGLCASSQLLYKPQALSMGNTILAAYMVYMFTYSGVDCKLNLTVARLNLLRR